MGKTRGRGAGGILRRAIGAMAAATALLPATAPAAPAPAFAPLASLNVPDGGVAEIVDATPDGRTLLYTDSAGRAVGVVDISDPAAPAQVARIPMPGEPTSVAVSADGARAFVAVQTLVREEGAPPRLTPGRLVVIDVASRTVAQEVEIGIGPDSVAATSLDGADVVVVAIENEPVVLDGAGSVTDAESPGLPGDVSGPGLVQVVAFEPGGPRVVDVNLDLAGTGLLLPDDPQPEFVALDGARAAVSLQENNGVAVLDLAAALAGGDAVRRVFSTGVAGDRRADLLDDDRVAFDRVYPRDVDPAEQPLRGTRTPDGLAFTPDGSALLSADEGEDDLTGGRGFSVWDPGTGRLLFEVRDLEAIAVRFGHYPDGRSDAKGIEVEGVATAAFGRRQLAFVGSERGSFVAVYDVGNPRRPRFLQLLPTGVEPEGILPIAERGLLVTSDEGSGSITILSEAGRAGRPATRPQISSGGVREPWSALSGLAGDPRRDDVLWSVPDNALPSALYRIDLRGPGARLRATPVTAGGEQARYDLEGIAVDDSIAAPRGRRGFWLASEGNARFGRDGYAPNLLVQVDARGRVLREVPLPEAVDSAAGGVLRGNGFEGVTVSDSGRYLVAAVQRDYGGDAAIGGVRHTRIARYDLLTERWDFFLYPLDTPPPGETWVGLSEITNLGGDRYAVIERDNAKGGAAAVKRVYEFTLDGVRPTDGAPLPAGADVAGAVIEKTLLRDVLAPAAPFEKVEGLALTAGRSLWAVVDNDGGEHESRLLDLGPVEEDVALWLTLVHNNDAESKLLDEDGVGGVSRFRSVVERLRGQAAAYGDGARRGALTVSSGDDFLAGPEFNASLERGVPFYDSVALDRIGYDALAIGNHEFDFGPGTLADLIRGTTRVPWLSANLDVSPEPALAGLADAGRIAPSTVVEVAGTRVGVVGATTERLPEISSPGGVVVGEVLPTVQAEVDRLRAEGVRVIILSSHLQSIEEDLALARLLRGVDVMIAGGGGELLANPDDPLLPGDAPSRPYPVLVRDADGRDLPIVTTSGDYRYAGRLIAGFDADGDLVRVHEESGPARVLSGDAPDAVKPDALLEREVAAPVRASVDALAADRLAETEVRLSGIRVGGVRTQETNLGDLVADALLREGRRAAAAAGLPEPVVALQNGGGIRNNDVFPDDLAAGVTELDTFRVLPFANFVTVVPEVSRETFLALLENAVSRVEFADGRFAQVAGFRFTWDAGRPAGGRVVEAVLDSGETVVSGGGVVPGAPISVATIDFLARGGDGYPFGGAPFTRSTVPYQRALRDHLTAPEAEGGLGGRITAARYPEIPSPGNGPRITRIN